MVNPQQQTQATDYKIPNVKDRNDLDFFDRLTVMDQKNLIKQEQDFEQHPFDEIESFMRLIKENRLTMSPEELKNQEQLYNQILEQQKRKNTQLQTDQEMAREINMQEIVKKQ